MQVVKIKYDDAEKTVSITANEKEMDISRISGKVIDEWLYPFMMKNVRWNGLYDELKEFLGTDEDISIRFFGSDASLAMMKEALKDKPIKIAGSDNKVVILYKAEPLSTKITVNGKSYNTDKLANRTIDEWIYPFQVKDIAWKGIFAELEDFIGTDEYSIQFVGNADDMKGLMDNCPENVSIAFKAPVAARSAAPKAPRAPRPKPPSDGSAPERTPSDGSAADNIKNVIGNVKQSIVSGDLSDKIKQEVSDDEIDKNLENIPIKNEFVRKNIMAICAAISLIFLLFPFIKCVITTKSEYMDDDVRTIAFSGLTSITGEGGSAIAILMILGPVLIILMNYIVQLKPYRRLIALAVPLLSIFFEIIVFISLKSSMAKVGKAASAVAEMGDIKQTIKTSAQFGFFFLLLSYILTAVVGYITYYGLPTSKKDE